MTYLGIVFRSRVVMLLGAVLCTGLIACGDSNSQAGAGGTSGPPPPMGCAVRDFAGEPDVILYPNIEAQTLPPNAQVVFTFTVDAETRSVTAQLADSRRRLEPSEPVTMLTDGNEALTFSIMAPGRSRFYVELTLCSGDCDESRVVYTLNPDNVDDPINDPYERILFEGTTAVRRDTMCSKTRSRRCK